MALIALDPVLEFKYRLGKLFPAKVSRILQVLLPASLFLLLEREPPGINTFNKELEGYHKDVTGMANVSTKQVTVNTDMFQGWVSLCAYKIK
jgi:hypothetical protein